MKCGEIQVGDVNIQAGMILKMVMCAEHLFIPTENGNKYNSWAENPSNNITILKNQTAF